MKNSVSGWIVFLLFNFLFVACDSISFELPQGPKGDDGKSAYQIWKDEVEAGHVDWPKDHTKVEDFLVYIKGVKGDKGDDGESAYDLWKEMIASGKVPDPHNPSVMWPSDKNSEVNFWEFLAGRDGNTPYIGDNNHWFIGGKDTGVPAKGLDGASAYESWKDLVAEGTIDWPKDHISMEHFFIYLKGKDGKDGANGIDGLNGKDGDTPYIKDGNWWIGGQDTGVAAKGDKGDTGETGGNGAAGVAGQSAYDLWLEELKKGTISWEGDKTPEGFLKYLKGDKGDKGDDGNDGKSAYELWKEMVEEGTISWNGGTEEVDFYQYLTGKDGESAYELWVKQLQSDKEEDRPFDHKTGKPWDPTQTTKQDFWDYLSGADGEDGKTQIVSGSYNVLIQTSQNSIDNGATQEYIDPITGGVTYLVYDTAGKRVTEGMKVTLMDNGKEYKTNSVGAIFVLNQDLPEEGYGVGVKTKVKIVDENNNEYTSAENTIIPHKMSVRLILNPKEYTACKLNAAHDLYFVLQRKSGKDGTWENINPGLLGASDLEYRSYRAEIQDGNVIILDPDKTLNANGNKGVEFQWYTYRYLIENEIGEKGDQETTCSWDAVYYFTVKLLGVVQNSENKTNGKYYGQEVLWNGVCKMAPWPVAPLLKSLHLIGKMENGEITYFSQAEGEFEFTDVHKKCSYKEPLVIKQKMGDVNVEYELVEPEIETFSRAYADFYIPGGNHHYLGPCQSLNTPNKAKIMTPYLTSEVWIKSQQSINGGHDAVFFKEVHQGNLSVNNGDDKGQYPYYIGEGKKRIGVTYSEEANE